MPVRLRQTIQEMLPEEGLLLTGGIGTATFKE